ncbi:MAG: hypothetical protein ACD_58C00071G0006 [uncultured bacterium]|nr:MAG: hypothetical protein ACD_58C00071G0006 [uncultured bacterium]
MYITSSKIYNLPVASLEANSKVGEVTDLVFSPEDLALIALEVKTDGFLFSKKLFLASNDIVDFDRKGIVIKNDAVLVNQSEIIRIKQIAKQKFSIYGQKVLTKSNKYLGKVFDLLIDSETCTISKLYVANFLDERIFDISKVEKITPKAIILSNDVIEQTPLAQTEEAVA